MADPRIVSDDSGPEKPGNSVEDKTLTTGTEESGLQTTPVGSGKSWTKGEDDNLSEPT